MFIMVKGNVEREVETEYLKNKLLALGYTELHKTGKSDEPKKKKSAGEG